MGRRILMCPGSPVGSTVIPQEEAGGRKEELI
jgi:hypothetical protein